MCKLIFNKTRLPMVRVFLKVHPAHPVIINHIGSAVCYYILFLFILFRPNHGHQATSCNTDCVWANAGHNCRHWLWWLASSDQPISRGAHSFHPQESSRLQMVVDGMQPELFCEMQLCNSVAHNFVLWPQKPGAFSWKPSLQNTIPFPSG